MSITRRCTNSTKNSGNKLEPPAWWFINMWSKGIWTTRKQLPIILRFKEFVVNKSQLGGDYGFEPSFLPGFLFDFQRHIGLTGRCVADVRQFSPSAAW